MTEPIDCFSSTPPPAHGERPPGALEEDYENVFEALLVSDDASAGVFARAVKFDVRQHLESLEVPIVLEMPDVGLLPCWVHQCSVTLRIPDLQGEEWAQFKRDNRMRLEALVRAFVLGILGLWRGGKKLHLIGAVTATVLRVDRAPVYSFLVKQKWAVSEHE